MRIKEMIANLRSFDCPTDTHSQYQKKCLEKSVENINFDASVKGWFMEKFTLN